MGGFAIKNAIPVRGDIAGNIAKQVIKDINDNIHIKAVALGSTGKKTKLEYSGDIDIAIDLLWNDKNLQIFKDFIINKYGNVEQHTLSGLKIHSIGYRYKKDIYQIDFMFTNDLQYALFMYHSPNFVNHESKFKGLYRTNLLVTTASKTPVNTMLYPTEYFDNSNNIKSFWKYSLSYTDGLKLVHKSYEGKRGPLKNPVSIKDDDIFVTKDLLQIIHIILGDNADISTCNSYESLIQYICSNEYKYQSKEQLLSIFNDFFNDVRHIKNQEVLTKLKSELNNYINKSYSVIF